MNTCLVCEASLDYSLKAALSGYCSQCEPITCPECGTEDIRQRKSPRPVRGLWRCANDHWFEVRG